MYEAFSKQYPTVNFLKCDVDAANAVAAKYKVTAMCAAGPNSSPVNLFESLGRRFSSSRVQNKKTRFVVLTERRVVISTRGLYSHQFFSYSGLGRVLNQLATSPGQASAEQTFPGRGNRLGGNAGAPPPNVQPAEAAAGGFKDLVDGVTDAYHRMNPQLKVLCGVVLLYVVVQTVF